MPPSRVGVVRWVDRHGGLLKSEAIERQLLDVLQRRSIAAAVASVTRRARLAASYADRKAGSRIARAAGWPSAGNSVREAEPAFRSTSWPAQWPASRRRGGQMDGMPMFNM